MENYAFKNYEEFKTMFPKKVSRDGSTYRHNKVLLAFLLSPTVRRWCRENDKMRLLQCSSMTELKALCMNSFDYPYSGYRWDLGNGWCGYSLQFCPDMYNGLCEDMDVTAIRYINTENSRVFKKKAGRFFKAVALETSFGKAIPEQVLLWLCEEFQHSWSTYASTKLMDNYTLHVDKDFKAIYSNDRCNDYFGSCMQGKGFESFYRDAVKCHAAYLTDENDNIVSRCVIYDECTDMNTGEIYRLAERQYAGNNNNIILKQILVNKLIAGGYIDGFKTVGADCRSPHAFETCDGHPLGNDFKIECNLYPGDTLSYQDSFKYYNECKNEAYNDDWYDYDEELTETDGVYRQEENRNYDSYHDYYTNNELQVVYYNGDQYYCDEERLEDFYWVEYRQEFHHYEDVTRCDECGEYELNDDCCYSELTEEYYCCQDCMDDAEQRYKEDNWTYSTYDGEYYEDDCDVVPYYQKIVSGDEVEITTATVGTINVYTADSLVEDGEFYLDEEGNYYEIVRSRGMAFA